MNMKPQIATTKEHSARLIACGVKPETADMCYMDINLVATPYSGMLAQWIGDSAMKGEDRTAEDFALSPAWSLSALLSLLPNPLFAENRMQYTLSLKPTHDCKAWVCAYDGHNTTLYCSNGQTAIEVAVRMIETLVFHNYQLNNIEQ